MADIKTKDAIKGTIKQIDKAAIASERIKNAYISTKDKAEHSTHTSENNASEYATDRIESAANKISHNAFNQFEKQARKTFNQTRENLTKAKNQITQLKEKRTAENISQKSAQKITFSAYNTSIKNVKAVEKTNKTVKQSAKSTGQKTIKTAQKGTVKTTRRSINTAEKTAKTAIKTSKQAAKTAQQAAKKSAKATRKSAKAAEKSVSKGVKLVAKATKTAIKAIITGTKALIATIAAGGWIAVVVIILLCLIGLILGSVFGVFFSGEDSGNGMTMRTAVQEINKDYEQKLEDIKASNTYDKLKMSGSKAIWKDVIAVYAVKINCNSENAHDVATMDDDKLQNLKNVFWDMTSISSKVKTKTVKEIVEEKGKDGKIHKVEKTVKKTTLYITVSHKSVDEITAKYRFNQTQKKYLNELLDSKNNALWSLLLHGISHSDNQIVQVAAEQLGNVGGQPYWSWYGFNSRVEWCACFVSWCANECGYIEDGIIPKYSICDDGVNWFKKKSQWIEGSEEPSPGMIIFFDWEYDGLDGKSDHTGIVEKVENGLVYTIEGNSDDVCKENHYPIGYKEILGYGVAQY